jgi:hypothetical protein
MIGKGFELLNIVNKNEKSGHDYVRLKVDLNNYMEYLEQSELAFRDDSNTVTDFARNLNKFNPNANIQSKYSIEDKEITDKILEGEAYDSESILCYLVEIL